MRNKCLIVLGMHRSGTSALSGALSRAGVEFGSQLLPPEAQNPKGFWEHKEIVALHDGLLRSLGSSWDAIEPLEEGWLRKPVVRKFQGRLRAILERDFSRATHWGVKDPRLCRLLPSWQPVLEEIACDPTYVLIVRHPHEVVDSLHSRNGTPEIKAYLSWLEHTISAETHSRGLPRYFLRYEDLLSDWRRTLKPLLSDPRVGLDIGFEAELDVDAFLDDRLRHHRVTEKHVPTVPQLLADQLYGDVSSGWLDEKVEAAFSVKRSDLAEYRREMAHWFDCLRIEVGHLRDEIELKELQLDGLNKEVVRIRSSMSWRLGMPARFLINLFISPRQALKEVRSRLQHLRKRRIQYGLSDHDQ